MKQTRLAKLSMDEAMRQKGLHNESKITITINTKFKKISQQGTDITKEIEQSFHNAMYDVIDNVMNEYDFEEDVLDILQHNETLPANKKSFLDFGEVSIIMHSSNMEWKK